jgi:hypothetical protein
VHIADDEDSRQPVSGCVGGNGTIRPDVEVSAFCPLVEREDANQETLLGEAAPLSTGSNRRSMAQ